MSELLTGTRARQNRVMLYTGVCAVLVCLLVVVAIAAAPARKPANSIELTLSTPVVGQGIHVRSDVMLRGVVVGTVASVIRRGQESEVRIQVDKSAVRELTDSFGFDFRPASMLGRTVLNLIPREMGTLLADGQRIARAPEINATMSQLLGRVSTVVNGLDVHTLAQSVFRATQYTNALMPLIESGLVLTNVLVATQALDISTTLRKTAALTGPLPDLTETVLTLQHNFYTLKGREALIDDWPAVLGSLAGVNEAVLLPVAELLASPRAAAGPATEIARSFADALSMQLQFSRGGTRVDRLLAGMQSAYSAADPRDEGAKAVKLRVMLEPLPVLQSGLPPLPGPSTSTPPASGQPETEGR